MKQKPGMTPSPQYNFAGGLVTMIAKTRLRPSQLIKAKNVNLLVDGEFEVRRGYAKVFANAFGATIDRFIHLKTDDCDKIIAYGDSYVKRLDTAIPAGWSTLVSDMPSTDDLRSMLIANDMLYFGSTAGVKKYVPYDNKELLKDGDLELWNSATDLQYWSEYLSGSSTINRDSSDKYQGSYSARIDIDVDNNPAYFYQTQIPCVPYKRHKISLWYKHSVGGSACFTFSCSGKFLNSSGQWVDDWTQITLPNATAWTEFTIEFSAYSASEYTLALRGHTGSSYSVWYDKVSVLRYPYSLWNAGIAKPTTAVTAAEGTAGLLTGTYTWYYTYYNSITDEESDPSPVSNELTVSSKRVNLTGFVASSDPQVDTIKIYRNTSGVSSQWFYVGEKDNDTQPYEDNVSDDNVGIELSFKNAIPPTNSPILLWHMNRMFYVDNDRLWWSEPYKPGSVPANNYQDIEVGDGGHIVALASSFGNIVVFKNNGVYCFFFNALSPNESTYEPIARSFGCAAPMSVCNVGEDLIFLSPEGLKKITNAGTALSGIEVLVEGEFGPKSIPAVANLMRDTQPETVDRAVGTFYENKNQYHLSVPFYGPGNNDLTIVWCIDSNAFVVHEDFYVKAAALYKEYDREVIYRSHNDQYIYHHDYGYTDNGTAIDFDVQTGFHNVNGIDDEKRIRLFFPILRGADTAQVTCEIIKDFEPFGSGFQKTVIHKGASYWGQAHWGQNYWGAGGEFMYRCKGRVKGRLFSTRFYGSTTLGVGVTGYQFYYQPRAL